MSAWNFIAQGQLVDTYALRMTFFGFVNIVQIILITLVYKIRDNESRILMVNIEISMRL